MLPQGVDTPNQYLFSVLDAETGTKVGLIWFAERRNGSQSSAFIYDIVINEVFRQQGYGKQTMRMLETNVNELGLDTISLHVFGHNKTAIAMYQALGYETTNMLMSKKLAPSVR
ncbi:MAG: GNAT family N-acetyltransferase [Herpetosiphon sp.]|nr:GNAT family N-acetyltransferase [Herpetosiphon sp.]